MTGQYLAGECAGPGLGRLELPPAAVAASTSTDGGPTPVRDRRPPQ